MSDLNQRSKSALDRERSEVLQQWESWLEMPMLVLGFAWLGLFIIEMIWGLNPLLVAIAAIIWITFIVDFGIKFLLAPRKISYLKHNWLIVFVCHILFTAAQMLCLGGYLNQAQIPL
jgi:voltage-gated potassium channel